MLLQYVKTKILHSFYLLLHLNCDYKFKTWHAYFYASLTSLQLRNCFIFSVTKLSNEIVFLVLSLLAYFRVFKVACAPFVLRQTS